MSIPTSPQILSYRHLLTGAVEDFLDEAGMSDPETTEALAEVLVTLSRYREEGVPLFPAVYIGDDLDELLGVLHGRDPIGIGQGAPTPETMRRALKQCAPLGRRGWSIFIVRRPGELRYGVFHGSSFILHDTPMEWLRACNVRGRRAIGVVQLAENVLELRSSGGVARYVYLSGARVDQPPPPTTLGELVRTLTRDVEPDALIDARTFYRRVFVTSLRESHGMLVAVLPAEPKSTTGRLFADGLLLESPIDVVAQIRKYRRTPCEETGNAIQAYADLLQGMMSADGITVLRTDGTIAGFNVFIQHRAAARRNDQPAGGARRRTFDALSGEVGHELVGAFYRSQDGFAEWRGDQHDASSPGLPRELLARE
jgi:hypothetical protein